MEQHYAEDRILTAWPASDELNRPFLGYVDEAADRGAGGELYRRGDAAGRAAAGELRRGGGVLHQVRRRRAVSCRTLQAGRGRRRATSTSIEDLPAAAIARMLHGRIVWQESSPGEWIAVIEIDKVREARKF